MSKLEILQEENRLAQQLADKQNELAINRLQFEQNTERQQANRVFLQSLANEARSEDLSKRIILAEFYSFLADEGEREDWEKFKDHLYQVQKDLNAERETLQARVTDPEENEAARNAAQTRIDQINRLENPAKVSLSGGLDETISFEEVGIDRRLVNGELRSLRNTTALSLIGNPRGTYDQQCRMPTNKRILALMVTSSFGPFRATLLRPAAVSLKRILDRVREDDPELHGALSTAGGLCARLVRGSTTAISSHSWGTAITLKINGKLDRRGDNRTQAGLLRVSEYFIEEGWYWGAAFRAENSMSFHVSDQLLRKWVDEGRLDVEDIE